MLKKIIKIIGRKGLEPSTAKAIEFTAQPVIPTNGTFLGYIRSINMKIIYLFGYC